MTDLGAKAATDPVQAYLDRLFDLMAGTGAAGRRALLEAESHLTEAVDALVAEGRSRGEAAREAIERFGPPERVAGEHARAGTLPFGAAVGQLFAAGWLLGGIGLTTIGLSGALSWAVARIYGPDFVAPDLPDATYAAGRCAELLAAYPDSDGCRAASVAHHVQELTDRPLMLGAKGLVLLALFWLARRSSALRGLTTLPAPGITAAAGVTAFGLATLGLFGFGMMALLAGQTAGVGFNFAQGAAALVAALVFLPRAFIELRRPTA
jgi:hypothetical protein